MESCSDMIWYRNLQNHVDVLSNQNYMTILLSIAKHEKRSVDDLRKEVDLDKKELIKSVLILSKKKFIEPNPTSKKYKLALAGQLLVEHLKFRYAFVNEFLEGKKILKPIRFT